MQDSALFKESVYFNSNATTIEVIYSNTLREVQLPLPPIQEQKAILDYLDRKTAVIDTLIAKKERQIELLQEQRTAVINHAVTKGLNPHAPRKDSGIPWLGQIPAHWELSLIKYKLSNVTDGAHVSPETENGVYPFISTVNVDDGVIDFENCLLTSKTSYEMLKLQGCQPEEGDVLFSKDGTIGKTVLIKRNLDFVVASSLIILKPNQTSVYPNFLDYFMQSSTVVEQINSFVKGSALKRISLVNLKRIYGPFPPLEEQTTIAVFLDKKTAAIRNAIRKVERQIELLQEYRTAVISAAVTGKIDVRP
jgi:type I restriction enzyme S subunit